MKQWLTICLLAAIGCVVLANLVVTVIRANVQAVTTAIQSIPPAAHYSRGIGGGTLGKCQTSGTGCAAALVKAMNADRAVAGAPPLKLSWPQSHGLAGCPGSIGHARAMVADSNIWHVSATHPAESFQPPTFNFCVPGWSAIGENVGVGLGTKFQAMMQDYQQMMSEVPPDDGHRQNILNPGYKTVGIGLAPGTYAGYSGWYVVQDFSG